MKIGLALSGGGALGAAHIGVIEEIEKAGIKIDCVCGTSAGAIIGLAYAIGGMETLRRFYGETLADFAKKAPCLWSKGRKGFLNILNRLWEKYARAKIFPI